MTIITRELIETRNHGRPCKGLDIFSDLYPSGLDISPLVVGNRDEASRLWYELLIGELRYWIGWAIGEALLPARITCTHLVGAKLDRADLRLSFMAYTNMREAALQNVDFRGAHLIGVNLSYANLKSANLKGANLEGANLRYANLSGASLERANLKDASIGRANLHNVNLYNAVMPYSWGDLITRGPGHK